MKSFNLFQFKLIYVLLVSATCLSLTSCEEDNEDNVITLSKSKIGIYVGTSEKITISGGSEPYKVESSDNEVATASVSSKEITVTGVKEGNVNVIVTDKNGKKATLEVIVAEDPKNDPTVRFVWDQYNKKEGTEKGTYEFSKNEEGKVEFKWKSEDGSSVIQLSFTEDPGEISVGTKKEAALTIDGTNKSIASLEVTQVKVVQEGEGATVWILFNAENKTGICVGKLLTE